MNKKTFGLIPLLLLTLSASTVNAELLTRLGGQAVYDSDLDITWLANANLAKSNSFGISGINSDGGMNWNTANNWITAMNTQEYLGTNNWRLPTITSFDRIYQCRLPSGIGCFDSELGHLFYNEFNATAQTSVLDTGSSKQLAKFNNVLASFYWTNVVFEANLGADPGHWYFLFSNGIDGAGFDDRALDFAWAVRDGDISAVPVPASLPLFITGLVGLLFNRRRRNTLTITN